MSVGGSYGECISTNTCCSIDVGSHYIDVASYCYDAYSGALCRMNLVHYTGIIDPNNITYFVDVSSDLPAGILGLPVINANLDYGSYIGFAGSWEITIADAQLNCNDGSGPCYWSGRIDFGAAFYTDDNQFYDILLGYLNITFNNGEIIANASLNQMCSSCSWLEGEYHPP